MTRRDAIIAAVTGSTLVSMTHPVVAGIKNDDIASDMNKIVPWLINEVNTQNQSQDQKIVANFWLNISLNLINDPEYRHQFVSSIAT